MKLITEISDLQLETESQKAQTKVDALLEIWIRGFLFFAPAHSTTEDALLDRLNACPMVLEDVGNVTRAQLRRRIVNLNCEGHTINIDDSEPLVVRYTMMRTKRMVRTPDGGYACETYDLN